MNENYLREIKGKNWLPQAQWEEKLRKDNDDFKARLTRLPVEEAKTVCIRYLGLEGVAGTPGARIALEWLAANT